MIYLLHGENEFSKRERLRELSLELGGEPERVDGEELELRHLQELVQGQTLFSESRLVIISDLSQSPVWADVPGVLDGVSSDIVLFEQKIDKRTKAYKWLKKQAKVEEFLPFGERDGAKVVGWAVDRAKSQHGLELTRGLADKIVERIGHDQMRIDRLLEQLALADEVDEKLLDALVPLPRMENIFELFEATLKGQRQKVQQIISYLELDSGADGAYQTLGLIVSQLVPLNALVLGGSSADVAKDFSVHPFVVQKLASHSRNITANQLVRMNDALGRADVAMKTTSVSPWLLLETALIEIGEVVN